jgi:hypothetical protein
MSKIKGYDDFGKDDDHQGRDDDHGRDDGRGENRDDGNDDHAVHKFGTVDANAIDPTTGDMYFGNGNHPTGYNLADNYKEHVELGLKVHERGGPDGTPTFDSHGNPTYVEQAGLQTPTRANWNFDYSVDTALGAGKHDTLANFDFKMTIANATHSETFDLNAATHQWVSETVPTHVFAGDDFNQHPATPGVVATEAENSVNIAFGAFNDFGTLAARTAAGQHYEVTLQAFEHHEQIAAVHDFITLV